LTKPGACILARARPGWVSHLSRASLATFTINKVLVGVVQDDATRFAGVVGSTVKLLHDVQVVLNVVVIPWEVFFSSQKGIMRHLNQTVDLRKFFQPVHG
jgi:hypothetical protein